MKLIKYRDPEAADYIWFWVNSREESCSPVFVSEEEAQKWMDERIKENYDWRPIRDIA